MTPKVKFFFENVFLDSSTGYEIRVVAKFGGNRPLPIETCESEIESNQWIVVYSFNVKFLLIAI